jgi:transcriptional regulator with XRE-family HTH domain
MSVLLIGMSEGRYMSKPKKPNRKLQHERELRGWSQQKVAAAIDTDEKRVGIWERGESTPSPFYRQKLCELYGKNAQELGFLDVTAPDDSQGESLHVQAASSVQHHAAQSVDLLSNFREDATSDQQTGLWLALSAQNLTPLFDEGWTPDMILEALHILLPGVHAMSQISRRTFGHHVLQLGATAFLGGIPIPTGNHISAEEKMHLYQALGESIAAGWKLFHIAGNAQVLAIGQAQLSLLQHVGPLLSAREQALLYSPVYRLIGGALHLQGRYDKALDYRDAMIKHSTLITKPTSLP